MQKPLKTLLSTFFLLTILVFPSLTFAVGDTPGAGGGQLAEDTFEVSITDGTVDKGFVPCSGNGCSACDFVVMANTIIKWLIGISFLFFALLAVIAGFKLITAGGNPGALRDAKSSFTNAFIGLIIILAAWVLVDTLMRTLTQSTDGTILGHGPWSQIQCGSQVRSDTVAGYFAGDEAAIMQPPSFRPADPSSRGRSMTLTLQGGGSVEVLPCAAGEKDLVSVSFLGKSVSIHKNLAPSLRRIDQRWRERGGNSFYRVVSVGGYVCRPIAGRSTLSTHSYGVTVDINPDANPHCPYWEQCNNRNVLITDMPQAFRQILISEGWGWGGNWRSSKDAMHFSKATGEGGNMRGE
jgi:hypothetical protein